MLVGCGDAMLVGCGDAMLVGCGDAMLVGCGDAMLVGCGDAMHRVSTHYIASLHANKIISVPAPALRLSPHQLH
jgi:hypothetical protein